MSESAPRLLIDARAARHQGREATLQLQRSRLADRRSGAVTVVAARTGRVHRPNQPMHTWTLSNWERLPAVRDAQSLRQSAPHASYGRSGRSGRACRCAWLQEPGEVGRRGDIHLGHRKILEAIGHGQHLLRFRPTKVGSSPRASSSRSTRCPVYPVAPSNPILRLSTALPSDGLCRVVSWPAG